MNVFEKIQTIYFSFIWFNINKINFKNDFEKKITL